MQTLNSISPVSKVISTNGSNPVVILAEDLNEYVCKYSGRVPANQLLIEYLGYSFANIWNIPIPPGKFINISDEHISNEILGGRIQRRAFHIPTFGSQVYNESIEIDKTVIISWKGRKAQLRRIINKQDFIKIGLFDLWLVNEDRNHNNFNLLLNSEDDGFRIVAIDHEKCFNSGIINLDNAPYQLNQDESILNTEVTPLLFQQGPEFNLIQDSILTEFSGMVTRCQEQLPHIIQHIPVEWGIDVGVLEEFLNSRIFVSSWLEETEQSFREFINNSFV